MQTQELLKYIKNPNSINQNSVLQLCDLVKQYPYFQPAHLLYSLATQQFDIASHQSVLKKAAISVVNRSVLHQLLNNTVDCKTDEVDVTISIQNKLNRVDDKPALETKVKEEENTNNEDLNEIKTVLNQIKEDINILKATELSEHKIIETDVKEENLESNTENQNLSVQNLEIDIQKAASDAYVNEEYFESSPSFKKEEQITPTNFIEWVKFLNNKNGATEDELKQTEILSDEKNNPKLKIVQNLETETDKVIENQTKKQKNIELIDKIIQSNPGSIRNKDEKRIFIANAQAKESLLENEHLVTETLAKIYALQGHISKAIRAYEILCLKIPQKSVYFASLIKNLKEKQ
ncbi:MAG: hypothetical protein LCH32_04415 [Bacteroidetes bacterium]|nr:hypothetical protein [Bacteroidota bacterium]